MIESTLLHEAIHAISNQHCLNLPERKVLALEHALALFIQDNPEIVDGLRRAKRKDPSAGRRSRA